MLFERVIETPLFNVLAVQVNIKYT